MPRIAALCLTVICLAWPALAQTSGPIMGSTATDQLAEAQVTDGKQFLVIGDALGGGLGAGMSRLAPGVDVTLRFVEESGVARPEIYDWGASLPKILEGKSYDTIVVLIGSNDRQMIKSGTLRHAFNSPEWVAAYNAQLDRILAALKASGARIFWVSLPPMAEADFEASMAIVSKLQRDRVIANGASFIDIHKDFLAADGSYTDSGPDDTGVVRKLRGKDGITFFKQGSNRLAQVVLAAIAKGAPPPAPEDAGGPDEMAGAQSPTASLPSFGQFDADGKDVVILPREVLVAMASGTSENFEVSSGNHKDLVAIVSPGSAAEKLFRLGVADAPPAGRIDDFSVPPAVQP